jgi:hypothetical protein
MSLMVSPGTGALGVGAVGLLLLLLQEIGVRNTERRSRAAGDRMASSRLATVTVMILSTSDPSFKHDRLAAWVRLERVGSFKCCGVTAH